MSKKAEKVTGRRSYLYVFSGHDEKGANELDHVLVTFLNHTPMDEVIDVGQSLVLPSRDFHSLAVMEDLVVFLDVLVCTTSSVDDFLCCTGKGLELPMGLPSSSLSFYQ